MRILFLFTLIIILQGCVSLSKYNKLLGKYNATVEQGRLYKKEIAQVNEKTAEIQNEMIAILLQKEDSLKTSISKKYIVKRLERRGIQINVNEFNPKVLTLVHPSTLKHHISLEDSIQFSKINLDTARQFKWLSNKEKDVYYWLNYARVKPRDFCETYLLPLLEKNYDPNYLLTLIDYMYEMNPVNPLVPDKAAYESARCHAETSGKAGIVGHNRLFNCKEKFWGECCSYGDFSARDHVIRLLIDEKIQSLGHRYICLSPNYKNVGISVAAHCIYKENVVLDFL
jgi:hypothetical protein